MDDAAARAAAQLLLSSWQTGARIRRTAERLRPLSRVDGYAVQSALQSLSGDTLLGWKIAATSPAGQTHIGVDGPLAGRLLCRPGARQRQRTRRLPDNHMRVAEPEFAFRMARDLLARSQPYSMDEVLAAVGTLHPAIEVPDSRYEDFAQRGRGPADRRQRLRPLLRAGRGRQRIDWRALDLAEHRVKGRGQRTLRTRGQGRQRAGRSARGARLARQRAAGAGYGPEIGTGGHHWNLHDPLGAPGRRPASAPTSAHWATVEARFES